MPKSRNRYARAQMRARYRKPSRRRGSTAWSIGIAGLVAVGVVLLVFTVANRNTSNSGLQLSDHWHAALGVNICGSWEPNQSEFVTRPDNSSVHAGIHTHGDGLIHMEPQNSSEIGSHATLGLFADYGDWTLSQDSVRDWTRTKTSNGDKCSDGTIGRWQWAVNRKVRHGNPADDKPHDGDVVVIAFAPKGQDLTKLGDPPSVANLKNVEGGAVPTEPPPSS